MKKGTLHILLLLVLSLMSKASLKGQEVSEKGFSYQVAKVYPHISITRENLNKAETLLDLNKRYTADWVREYKSVEITANVNGKSIIAYSKNDTLTCEQKTLLLDADEDAEINVSIKYIPENTLVHNEEKEFDFSFWIEPTSEARFLGGKEALYDYLKTNALKNIKDSSFQDYDVVIINFTIDETGKVIAPSIFQKSQQEDINQALKTAICEMPKWYPAEYASGLKTKQEMTFVVGNMQNCMLNLVNFRPERFN